MSNEAPDHRTPISWTAMLQRLRRRLADNGEHLHSSRSQTRAELGHYYTTDSDRQVTRRNVDPEALARELGVVAVHERVLEERCDEQIRRLIDLDELRASLASVADDPATPQHHRDEIRRLLARAGK